jgi:hypothetical protein
MKRMIACAECAKREIPNYPGEYYVRIMGTAKDNMKCDWCYPATPIKKGDVCAAETLGLYGCRKSTFSYAPWEDNYINVRRDDDQNEQGRAEA